MNYFELAKNLVRMNEEWRQHGYVGASEIERLPQADLQVLLRPLRPEEPGISGDDGVPVLLR
jgi:hypothetical protein